MKAFPQELQSRGFTIQMERAGAIGNSRESQGCPRCLLCISWPLKGSFFSFAWLIKITNYYQQASEQLGTSTEKQLLLEIGSREGFDWPFGRKGRVWDLCENSMRWLCIVLQRVETSIWACRSSVNYWQALQALVAHQENATNHFLGIFYFWGSFERNNPAVEVKVEAASQRFLAFLNCSATENQRLQQRHVDWKKSLQLVPNLFFNNFRSEYILYQFSLALIYIQNRKAGRPRRRQMTVHSSNSKNSVKICFFSNAHANQPKASIPNEENALNFAITLFLNATTYIPAGSSSR